MKKRVFYGWWVVAGCILISTTVVPVVSALFNVYLLQVITEMNISRSSFTFTQTILLGLGILFSPLIGKKMSQGNMRLMQSISVLGFAVSYLCFSFAENIYHFYIIAVFTGIFYMGAFIPVPVMIANWFIKQRGLAMSLTMGGVGLGGFLFSPVVSYLLENYGWRTAYQVMAVIVFVLAWPMATFVLRKKPEDMGLKAYGADDVVVSDSDGKNASGIILSMSESKKKPFFLIMLLGMFLCGFINTGALGHFPPTIQAIYGGGVAAAILSLYSLIGIFGKVLLGWINDRFGIIKCIVFATVCFSLIFVFILMRENMVMLYIMAICFGLGMGIGNVVPPLIVGSIFGSEKYGEAWGYTNSAIQLGLATGSLAVAWFFDKTGSYDYAWMGLFVITLITGLCYINSIVLSRKYLPQN